MIDNIAVLIFSTLIVYVVFRAIKLDKLIPWFSTNSEEQLRQRQRELAQKRSKKGMRK